MVLAIVCGFAARALGGWPEAPWIAAVVGVVAAPLVVTKGSCGLRNQPTSDR